MEVRTTKALRPARVFVFAAALACSGGESASTGATTSTMTSTAGTTGTTGTTGASMSSTAASVSASASSTSASASTSTTSSTSTTDDSAGGTETGCSFLECDIGCFAPPGLDGAVRCSPPPDCDLWEQQDCEDGEKCAPWANDGGDSLNAAKCVPVDANPKKPGEPCLAPKGGAAGVDDCELGAMCWDVDEETKEGVCVGLCDGSIDEPTCAEPATSCVIANDGVLILCLPTCDPLAQDCPDSDLCLPVGEGFGCVSDASGEGGAYGDPCEYANSCKPGLACLNPEYVPDCQASGCCSPFCDTSAPNTCPTEGQVCIPWYEEGMAPPGLEHVGVCGVPQP